jgi:hypothetical protein
VPPRTRYCPQLEQVFFGVRRTASYEMASTTHSARILGKVWIWSVRFSNSSPVKTAGGTQVV